MVSIREDDPERDAPAVAELTREYAPATVISAASWLHRARTVPARAGAQGWTAEDAGLVVGHSFSCRNFFAKEASSAICGVIVRGSHRGRGIGTELHRLAVEHARSLGTASLLVNFQESPAGVRFALAHGFRETRAETLSLLDPRTISDPVPDLDLRPVSGIDPRLVYEIDIAATRDMPASEPAGDMPYEEWEQHVLRHPLFTPQGSFVALVDGVPASLSLLTVDRESGRAGNFFTGTLAAHRGRGLAHAVKLASIEWAAANGVRSLTTTNDERNAPMLAVNRRLGYVPAGRRVEYMRELI